MSKAALHFRSLTLDDASSYQDLLSDDLITRFSATVPKDPDMEWVKRRLQERNFSPSQQGPQEFGLFLPDGLLVANALWFRNEEDDRAVEDTTEIEIGYCVHRDWRGLGYAQIALDAIVQRVRTAFNHGQPIKATVAADNKASIYILEKYGFVKTATKTGKDRKSGRDMPIHTYLLKTGLVGA